MWNKSATLFWSLVTSKLGGYELCQIFWPSQIIWTLYRIHATTMKKKQSWENKSRMHIQNLFQLIVTDYSAMHCYYSCGLPNCLTSKVSKLAQNWGSKWPWYAIIVIFLHYWRAIFFCSLTRQEVFLVCDLLEKIMLPTKNVAASLGSTKVNRAKTLIVTPNYVLPLI